MVSGEVYKNVSFFQSNENGFQGGRKRKASGDDAGAAKKPYNNFVKVCTSM